MKRFIVMREKQASSSNHEQEKLVAIVVPYYTNELTADEELSLKHLRKFLGHYDKYLLMPESMPDGLDGFGIKRFEDKFFASRVGYNKLVLSPHFYKAFSDYKYILIYQLDALVFSDQLMEWCAADFDYIGAPWLNTETVPEDGFSRVGNGGFCLRKVESVLKVLRAPGTVVDPDVYWEGFCTGKSKLSRFVNLPRKYLKRLEIFNGVWWYRLRPRDAEDIFWGYMAQRLDPQFKIASVEEGLRFAFEFAPRYCFEQNNRQLPFGCHAWNKHDREFWEPYLLK